MYDTLLVTVSLSDLKVDQSELATGGDAMYCNEVCSQNATRTKIQNTKLTKVKLTKVKLTKGKLTKVAELFRISHPLSRSSAASST